MKKFVTACVLMLVLVNPLSAQGIASRGPVLNPTAGTVLADLPNIVPGPHRFRIIASASTTTSIVVEWRDARRALKWQQGLMVTSNATLIVPIDEDQDFESGDTLQLVVYANAPSGTVWASLSLK